MAHPVIRRIEAVVLVGSVLAAVVGGYIFLAHLNELMEDKRELDKIWLDLDREGHQAILDQCKAAQHATELLAVKLDADWSLPYRLGLRDGEAVCRSQEE